MPWLGFPLFDYCVLTILRTFSYGRVSAYCLLFLWLNRHAYDVGHRYALDAAAFEEDHNLAVVDHDATHINHQVIDSGSILFFNN